VSLAPVAGGQPPFAFVASEKPLDQIGGVGSSVGQTASSIMKNIRVNLSTIHRIHAPFGRRIAGQQFFSQKPFQLRSHNRNYFSFLRRFSVNIIPA
jgi:hypothetical protein